MTRSRLVVATYVSRRTKLDWEVLEIGSTSLYRLVQNNAGQALTNAPPMTYHITFRAFRDCLDDTR